MRCVNEKTVGLWEYAPGVLHLYACFFAQAYAKSLKILRPFYINESHTHTHTVYIIFLHMSTYRTTSLRTTQILLTLRASKSPGFLCL